MRSYDYEYPDPTCMECGGLCDRDEVVWTGCNESPWERWGYCEKCDVDTFHPGVKRFMDPMLKAAWVFEQAAKALREIAAEGEYTVGQVKTIRAQVLKSVREQLDPLLGPMPDERHY